MAICDSCGNNYERSLVIEREGRKYHFDSFECAIRVLAPECKHCGTRILGHGMEAAGNFYCCAHCARAAGHGQMRDSA